MAAFGIAWGVFWILIWGTMTILFREHRKIGPRAYQNVLVLSIMLLVISGFWTLASFLWYLL